MSQPKPSLPVEWVTTRTADMTWKFEKSGEVERRHYRFYIKEYGSRFKVIVADGNNHELEFFNKYEMGTFGSLGEAEAYAYGMMQGYAWTHEGEWEEPPF